MTPPTTQKIINRMIIKRTLFTLAGVLLISGIHMVEFQHGLDDTREEMGYYGPGY